MGLAYYHLAQLGKLKCRQGMRPPIFKKVPSMNGIRAVLEHSRAAHGKLSLWFWCRLLTVVAAAAAVGAIAPGDPMVADDIDDDLKQYPSLSFYRQGEFIDLCRGPHIPHAGKIAAFKLLNIAGAYWKNDASRKQLQRLYGTAYFSAKDLEAYLHQQAEARFGFDERSHSLIVIAAGNVHARIRESIVAFERSQLK